MADNIGANKRHNKDELPPYTSVSLPLDDYVSFQIYDTETSNFLVTVSSTPENFNIQPLLEQWVSQQRSPQNQQRLTYVVIFKFIYTYGPEAFVFIGAAILALFLAATKPKEFWHEPLLLRNVAPGLFMSGAIAQAMGWLWLGRLDALATDEECQLSPWEAQRIAFDSVMARIRGQILVLFIGFSLAVLGLLCQPYGGRGRAEKYLLRQVASTVH